MRRQLDRPVAKPRPVYLDLPRIRLPLPAIVSILHRISGALLFLVGDSAAAVGRRSEPRVARGVRAIARRFCAPAREARAHRAAVGVSASLLRGHPPPAAGHAHRHRPRSPRASSSAVGDWCCASLLTLVVGGPAMVTPNRHAVGAHYGLARLARPAAHRRRDGALHAARARHRAVARRPRLRVVDRRSSPTAASGSRRSCSWWRCSGTRGSACATS